MSSDLHKMYETKEYLRVKEGMFEGIEVVVVQEDGMSTIQQDHCMRERDRYIESEKRERLSDRKKRNNTEWR